MTQLHRCSNEKAPRRLGRGEVGQYPIQHGPREGRWQRISEESAVQRKQPLSSVLPPLLPPLLPTLRLRLLVER